MTLLTTDINDLRDYFNRKRIQRKRSGEQKNAGRFESEPQSEQNGERRRTIDAEWGGDVGKEMGAIILLPIEL